MARKHSRIGASAAKRWLNCPGSVRMQRDIPDVSSEAADEGTAAHDLAERVLKAGTMNVNEHLGQIIRVEQTGREFEVTDEMVEGVQLYVDTVRADREALLPGVKANVEKMFRLDDINKELYGTNDASLGQTFGILKVYDLKYGRGIIVEPEFNEQMMIYALGALSNGGLYEDVELVIVQPRAPHSSGPVRRWNISVDDLNAWALGTLKPGAEAALKEDAPVNAGDWCRFCKAMATCTTVRDKACEVAKVVFDEPGKPPVFPAPAKLSGTDIAQVMKFSSMFASWSKEVELFARAQMDRGVEVPGYKLVRGKKSRSWEDEFKTVEQLLPRFGDILHAEPKLRTVTQMEKEIKSIHGLKKAEIENVMDGLVRIDQGLTMAKADDKRPAVRPAIEAFNDTEEK